MARRGTMRAAYLVRPRDNKFGSSRELPSETTGRAPELIEVAPDTDWMSSFPEENSMWSVVTRDSVPPPTEAPRVRSSAPAYIPPYAPAYTPGPSMKDYWPHAAAVAAVVLGLGGIIGWFVTRGSGTAPVDQVSVS